MHIMEGFLPPAHALGWAAASLPFLAFGLHSVKRSLQAHPERRMLLGVAAAFAFLLSALKLPSVTGSCSHPTGVGFGALLFGPAAMVPVGFVVLLFQALLLAHGGLTTLGANVFSMAVVGPFVAYGVFRAAAGLNARARWPCSWPPAWATWQPTSSPPSNWPGPFPMRWAALLPRSLNSPASSA